MHCRQFLWNYTAALLCWISATSLVAAAFGHYDHHNVAFLTSPQRQNRGPSLLRLAAARTRPSPTTATQARRRALLEKDGPYFDLNRFSGRVEFGSTANLVTRLAKDQNEPQHDILIPKWLSEERRVAMSIWDEKLIKDKGDSVFELKVMTLQFVTITLAPKVDVQMWTTQQDHNKLPVFNLQSVAFDPNIQILPGVGLNAKDLGVNIDVVGELYPTKDGQGVTGRISFRSSGLLPGPMRILPEVVLKTASDTINETITQFAIKSFQRGAISNYRSFVAEERARTSVKQVVAVNENKYSSS